MIRLKINTIPVGKVNKSQLAKEIGVSRSSFYYHPKREKIDTEVKSQIESVLVDHPEYGHKRIALQLKLNKKRINRVMKKYGIKPYRKKVFIIPKKPDDLNKPKTKYSNLIEGVNITKPNHVWCTDFTFIRYETKFIYLATIIDLFTREIVGANISRFHNRFLVIRALENALEKYSPPEIIHSDQGSEYDSDDFTNFAELAKINISMSDRGSPWQNGYQESFYGRFKDESGDLERFDTLGELMEYIYQRINYYNTERIQTAIRMTPKQKRQSFYQDLNQIAV